MSITIIIFIIVDIIIFSYLISKRKSEIAATHTACENKIALIRQEHALQIIQIRQDYEMQIQSMREKIENRKAVLLKMDEKELLANIMIALDGYGNRFDRIEKQFTNEEITEKMTQSLQEVTTKINSIKGALITQIDAMNSSIKRSLNDSNLMQRMDNISSDLNSLSSDLDAISSDIDDIKSSVSNYDNYDSISSNIDSIQSDVSSIESDVSSIRYDIDTIKDVTNEIKDIAESARYAAESAKDIVESHF